MRFLFALPLLAIALPTAAQDAAPAQPKPEKRICRVTMSTGTILSSRQRKECHTKAEWARIDGSSVTGQTLRDRQNGGAAAPIRGTLGG
jgi:hypothetical protein